MTALLVLSVTCGVFAVGSLALAFMVAVLRGKCTTLEQLLDNTREWQDEHYRQILESRDSWKRKHDDLIDDIRSISGVSCDE